MTDELTPEQETAVRRLLSEARHDGPMPADVAARLDAVLGDLGADDLEIFESATVTELAGVRHRRRNAGRLLLAAAAVVVGGVAAGQVLGQTSMSDSDEPTSSADAGGQAEMPRDSGVPSSDAGDADGADEPEEAAPEAASDLMADLDAPLRLRSESFADDVERELRTSATARSQAAVSGYNALTSAVADSSFVCAAADFGDGAKLPVYYDAEEAVLVLRRPQSGIQRVDLLACGTAVPLNSVDLPAE